MPPTQFASSDPLPEDGRPRIARPSRLDHALELPGEKAEKAGAKLGLTSIAALLDHIPRDRRAARTIGDLVEGETATVVVEVLSITSRQVRRRGMKPLVAARVSDETGTMGVTFFNQPWLERRYRPGTRLLLTGKYQGQRGFRVNEHAETGELVSTGEDMATYPASDGLTSVQIAALVHEQRAEMRNVLEPLPARIRALERLPDRWAAVDAAHFGDQEGGRRRLAFDEFLLLQIALLRRRARRREGARAEALSAPGELTARWLRDSLPFTLTGDQQRAMATLDEDVASDRPMQRLLMGEVGSGKTVVALYAMLRAVESGGQAALMAPTETLAEQHFATLQKLMPGELVQAALLTGSTPQSRRTDLLGKLASGELKILVGTHALIEDAVEFDRLLVAVVDEQHRFGVNQRRKLDRKAPAGRAPHILHMTATPIPRTLALTAYGDLDVTSLHELPAGRRPIVTHVASTDNERARAYERIREELDAGRQAFVVCPLVEESEALQARAATAEFERLRGGELKDYRVVLMHGQMRPREKQEAMKAFAARRRGRARRDDRDRGRHRRPERDRDARRGLRALRAQPAPPAAGPDRPRPVRLRVPALRPQGVPPAAGHGPALGRLPPGGDRPRAAGGGGDARRAPVRPAGVQVRPPARGPRAARAGPTARPRDHGQRPRAARRPSTR